MSWSPRKWSVSDAELLRHGRTPHSSDHLPTCVSSGLGQRSLGRPGHPPVATRHILVYGHWHWLPERHLWCRLASCPTGNYWSCGPAVNVSENDAYLPALSECQENASQHAFIALSLLPHLTFFRAVTIYWTRCDAADLDGCRCTCNAGFHPEEPVSQWLWRL